MTAGTFLWLEVGGATDPAQVPVSARDAMAGANEVRVLPGAAPALSLWAHGGDAVVAGAPDASAALDGPSDGGVVWLAPSGPEDALANLAARRQRGVRRAAVAAVRARVGPLSGATVVLTRPWETLLEEACAYAELGARVLPWPLSMPDASASGAELDAAVARARDGAYAAVGITSARAAEAWLAANARAGAAPTVAVVAVGRATARVLARAGMFAFVTDGGGAELGRRLASEARGGRVLLVGAADGRPEALEAVRAAGGDADAVAAYAMVEPPWRPTFDVWVREALDAGGGDGVYFTWFSPRAVERGLRAMGPDIRASSWVAVGRTTAETARRLGPVRGGIAVAQEASAASVRAAVVASHRERLG